MEISSFLSSKRKLVFGVIGLIVLTSILGVIAFTYLPQQVKNSLPSTPSLFSNKTPPVVLFSESPEPLAIIFESQIKGYQIDPNTINRTLLTKIVEETHFAEPGKEYTRLRENKKIKPKTILFRFQDLTEASVSEKDLVDVVKYQNAVYRAFTDEFDEKSSTLTINIFYNTADFTQKSDYEIVNNWTADVFRFYFFNLRRNNPNTQENQYQVLYNTVLGDGTSLFGLKLPVGISFHLIPQAYAGCLGSFTCGVRETSCSCSSGGGSCNVAGQTCGGTTSCTCSVGGAQCSGNNSLCGPGLSGTCQCNTVNQGTCSCSNVCQPNSPQSCGGASNSTSCYAIADATCDEWADFCISQDQCFWRSENTEPDPTPTEPPPPGSCSGGEICMGAAANCGAHGRTGSGASCTGGICCGSVVGSGGGGECATPDTGDLCTDREDCCGDSNDDIQCTTAPNRTGRHCYDCEDLAEEHCPTNPRLQCGQTIPGVGSACTNEARCPDTQTRVTPPAPTNLTPENAAETDGTPLCNLACTDDFDCGAYLVELKRDSNIVHFDGINEGGTIAHDNNSRFDYKEGWSLDSGDDARGGSGRWTQAAGAYVYFPTIFKNITVYTGTDDDGGNLSAYVNGDLKKTVSLDCNGQDCENHDWGTSFALNVAGTAREYVCHNSQCRLDAAKGSANCQNDDTNVVKLRWNRVTGYNTYEIQIYPNDNRTCTDPNAICQTVYDNTYVFFPPTGTSRWAWRVRAVNDLCPGLYRGGAWSGRQIFTMVSSISGRFYLDTNNEAQPSGGICDLTGKQALNVPADTRVRVTDINGNNHTATITNSSYTVEVPTWTGNAANNVVTVTNPGSNSDGDYEVTCPNDADYAGIESPQSGVNFFLRPPTPGVVSNPPWWQVTNGHIYAGDATLSIKSLIPSATCIAPGCTPYFSKQNSAGNAQSAGTILTAGGEVDTEDTTGYQSTYATQRTGTPTIGRGTDVSYLKEKYDNFYRLFEMPADAATTDDFAATADDAALPTAAPLGGKAAYYHEGNLKIQSPWDLTTSSPVTSVVIFVNGNLTLDDVSSAGQLIQADPGTFLAFIVKGNVIIENTVGNRTLTSSATNLEGVYIADGSITIRRLGAANGGDKRFVGAGSFIGWGGVKLQRNFASDSDATRVENNNTIPAESFVFRPDYVKNIPEKMTSTQYVWQETN
jgi:hypothetical protein